MASQCSICGPARLLQGFMEDSVEAYVCFKKSEGVSVVDLCRFQHCRCDGTFGGAL